MAPNLKEGMLARLSDNSDISSPMQKAQALLDATRDLDTNMFGMEALRDVKLLSATEDGKVEYEFTVTANMCNLGGTLHGGCAATLMDVLTSIPAWIISKPGFLDGGTVSRTLMCTYMKALKEGDKVKVVSEILGAGKRTCHMRGEMLTEDGKVAVSCTHDKVPTPLPKL